MEVIGDDKVTYTWDNEKNEFYNKKTKKYGTKDDFVNSVKKCILYLKKSAYAAGIIEKVSGAKHKVTIKNSNANYYVVPSTKSTNRKDIFLYFCTTFAIKINDGTESFESPALGLFHEISHSYSHLVEHKLIKREKDFNMGNEWKNGEEYNSVQMTNTVANQIGEPVRYDYISATAGYVQSVTVYKNSQKK